MSSFLEKLGISLPPVGISPFSSFHLPYGPPCCSCSGAKPQRDLVENSYPGISSSGKSTRFGVFIDRAGPRNEAAQLPGQWEDMQSRKKSVDKKRVTKIGVQRLTRSCGHHPSTSTSPLSGQHGPQTGASTRVLRAHSSVVQPQKHLPPLHS